MGLPLYLLRSRVVVAARAERMEREQRPQCEHRRRVEQQQRVQRQFGGGGLCGLGFLPSERVKVSLNGARNKFDASGLKSVHSHTRSGSPVRSSTNGCGKAEGRPTAQPVGLDDLNAAARKDMGKQYERAISFGKLRAGLRKCARNVRWKDSVFGYEWNGLKNTYRLRQSLLRETYRIDPYQRFTIHEPKERDIVATRIKDRQFQRALCDEVLTPEITRHFIRDNAACIEGRGVDDALDRMSCHLERYWRQQRAQAQANTGQTLVRFNATGWVLRCDLRKFFESTPHSVSKAAIAARVADKEAARHCMDIIDSFGGDCGTGLGSQCSQLAQLAVLDDMDHFIKERLHIRAYVRFADDFILVHESREHLQHCLDALRGHLGERGLTLHPKKTMIHPLKQGIRLLGWRLILTDRGKVVRKVLPEKIRQEKRKLRKLRMKLDAGKLTMHQVREHYRSCKAHLLRGNTRQVLAALDAYYTELFNEEAPTCKKRRKRKR